MSLHISHCCGHCPNSRSRSSSRAWSTSYPRSPAAMQRSASTCDDARAAGLRTGTLLHHDARGFHAERPALPSRWCRPGTARRHEEVTAFGRGMKLTQLNGRRTLVWGLGKEGRAAARAALKAGASDVVAVVDDPPASAVVVAWSDAGLSGIPILSGPTAQAACNAAEVV